MILSQGWGRTIGQICPQVPRASVFMQKRLKSQVTNRTNSVSRVLVSHLRVGRFRRVPTTSGTADATRSIECGSGTYVRSLGRDLAESVGTAAVMAALVRTRIGPFTIETALDPAALTSADFKADSSATAGLSSSANSAKTLLDKSAVAPVLSVTDVTSASSQPGAVSR